MGNEGLDFVIRYEVLPVNALRNKELPEKEKKEIKAEQNESFFFNADSLFHTYITINRNVSQKKLTSMSV